MPFDTNVYAVCPVVIYNSVLENRSFVDHFFTWLFYWYAGMLHYQTEIEQRKLAILILKSLCYFMFS